MRAMKFFKVLSEVLTSTTTFFIPFHFLVTIIKTRGVHGSGWVRFVPNSDSTRLGQVGENHHGLRQIGF